MSRYREHILAHLPSDVRTWEDLTSTKYATLWQNLAHWRVQVGERTREGEIAGKRATELAIVLLAQAGRWLTDDAKLPQLPKMPKKEWRDSLNKDWATITGDREVERAELRHTPEELGLLWQAVDANRGDPRIRLVLRTAAEARLGQALRCDRTLLDLSETGAHGLGRFTVPDTGKKKGVSIDLTPELRPAWDHELKDGYLADLEAAYVSGRIRTYPLFPSGRLAGAGARAKSMKAIDKGVALDRFHHLERAAGVAVVPGRGWNGVRRISADLAEDVETDGRALNAITGHASDEMRRKVYQQKKRDLVLAKAATARVAARQKAVDAAKTAGLALPTPDELKPEAPRPRRQRQPRKWPTYAPRACPGCGEQFTPTGANTRACERCSPRRVRRPKMATAALSPELAMTPRLPPDLPHEKKRRGRCPKARTADVL